MNLIDITLLDYSGWYGAIHGMRNSRQSWDKSDTEYTGAWIPKIGPNDLELASKLAKAGGSHAKFRRMIHVQMDINAALYWWKQFDTYKVGVTTNSTSTMYSITNKEFTVEDFAREYPASGDAGLHLIETVNALNKLRESYLNFESDDGFINKHVFWNDIICLLPESYKQLRTVDLNYEVLAHMCKERKGHKLAEWKIFIDTMREGLPYAKELIFCEGEQHGSE